QVAAGDQDAMGLGQGAAIVRNVLEDLVEHHGVEALAGERQSLEVGLDDPSREPQTASGLDLGLEELDAIGPLSMLSERRHVMARAAPAVEDPQLTLPDDPEHQRDPLCEVARLRRVFSGDADVPSHLRTEHTMWKSEERVAGRRTTVV